MPSVLFKMSRSLKQGVKNSDSQLKLRIQFPKENRNKLINLNNPSNLYLRLSSNGTFDKTFDKT